MTRIKFCGITRPEDAVMAVKLGVDAIGLVFYPPSPRYVTLEQAKGIVAALPPFINIVGLFVDAAPETIRACLDALPLDTLQFHGNESPEQCCRRRWNKKIIKALRVDSGMDLSSEMQRYSGVDAILLDSYQKGVPGGTGRAFDWDLIPAYRETPVILAGGLNEQAVAEAIRQVKPYGVDVSGGIEAEKGIKDAMKMKAFAMKVRALNH